jgi:hypothetical protein
VAFLAVAAYGFAQRVDEVNGKHTQLYPDKDHAQGWAKPGGGGGQNLSYHGGRIVPVARVVAIFWGNEWTGNSSSIATEITNFFGGDTKGFLGFGLTPEYNVITQYSDGSGNHVSQTSLLGEAFYDTTAPPTNVTDAAVQGEVSKYLSSHTPDSGTIYEVFLPSTSYASYGNLTSCGGPNLYFCAYHSNFNYGGQDILYASMPYPSCGGCQWSGWTPAQNFEHFACHETREAVTDADGTAWYDRQGNEADDKCAWSPAPFLGTGGYGYQYEWSNSARGCVKSQ